MARSSAEYIVVEGPIGVGKTTLARRLADSLQRSLLLEKAEDNPFLPEFYENPRTAALPTQLHFLFQRARQIEEMRQADLFRPAQVADFLMQKDELFARVTLNPHELDLYYQVYNRLSLDAPAPDLVIYLQAPVEVLLDRIRARGVEYERRIEEAYLRRVANAYVEFFYHYQNSPLLIVNTEGLNLANGTREFELLLGQVQANPPGRHFLNPRTL